MMRSRSVSASALARSSFRTAISVSIIVRPFCVTRLRCWLTGRSPTSVGEVVSSCSRVNALLMMESYALTSGPAMETAWAAGPAIACQIGTFMLAQFVLAKQTNMVNCTCWQVNVTETYF